MVSITLPPSRHEGIPVKSFALLLCVVLAASSSALFAQTEQPAKEVVTKFETLRGEVVDSQGNIICLLYTSPSPRDATLSRMPSSA